jgi:hypothetical protein
VDASSVRTAGGVATNVTWFDWRVTSPDGGIVSDSRARWVGVYKDHEQIVYAVFGPVIHGLYLSGNLSIYCPEF